MKRSIPAVTALLLFVALCPRTALAAASPAPTATITAAPSGTADPAVPDTGALPLAAGQEALAAQFTYVDFAPYARQELDYNYYAPPVREPGRRYPLMIWLHGSGQGASKLRPLATTEFPNWASAEFQSRFPGGGAYLLVARAPEERGLSWKRKLCAPLKALIDDFIAGQDGAIDENRIYVGGLSLGGRMTLQLVAEYPSFFAAAFPLCAAYTLTEEEAARLSHLPMWFIHSTKDTSVAYRASEDSFRRLSAATECPADCRFTTVGQAYDADGNRLSHCHRVWWQATNDMFLRDGTPFPESETVDASGTAVTLTYPDGMIAWLSAHRRYGAPPDVTPTPVPTATPSPSPTPVATPTPSPLPTEPPDSPVPGRTLLAVLLPLAAIAAGAAVVAIVCRKKT